MTEGTVSPGSLLMGSGVTALVAGGVVALLWELTGIPVLHTISFGAAFGGSGLALVSALVRTRELREENDGLDR